MCEIKGEGQFYNDGRKSRGWRMCELLIRAAQKMGGIIINGKRVLAQ